MAYASVAQFRAVMTQITTGATYDALILQKLDEATGVINGALGPGNEFKGYLATATAKRISAGGSCLLLLPYYESGSLTSIAPVYSDLTTGTAYTRATDYEIEDDDHTVLYNPGGWPRQRYEVTAKWGFGQPPVELTGVCVEIAVNLWLGGQGGQFTDVVGIEGVGAVGYNRAFTNRQRQIIEAVRTKYHMMGVG